MMVDCWRWLQALTTVQETKEVHRMLLYVHGRRVDRLLPQKFHFDALPGEGGRYLMWQALASI